VSAPRGTVFKLSAAPLLPPKPTIACTSCAAISAAVALEHGRAWNSLKEELAPPCAGLFFSPRRSFIGCKKSPALLAGEASRSILLRGGLSTFLPNKAFAENLSTFLPSKANAGSGRWFPMPWHGAVQGSAAVLDTGSRAAKKQPRVSGAEE